MWPHIFFWWARGWFWSVIPSNSYEDYDYAHLCAMSFIIWINFWEIFVILIRNSYLVFLLTLTAGLYLCFCKRQFSSHFAHSIIPAGMWKTMRVSEGTLLIKVFTQFIFEAVCVCDRALITRLSVYVHYRILRNIRITERSSHFTKSHLFSGHFVFQAFKPVLSTLILFK